MSRARWLELAGLAAVPLVAAMAILPTTTVRLYRMSNTGRVTYAGSTQYASSRNESFGALCGASGCEVCGNCHAKATTQVMNSDAHLQTYFPKAELRLAEGQRYRFDARGGYVVLQGGKLAYYSLQGQRLLIAPTGSRLLKDSAGVGTLVYLSGTPTLLR